MTEEKVTYTVPKVKLPEEERKEGKEIIVSDAEIYQLMDKRDEAQIIASLEGRYLEEFVYEFEQGGRKIVGLSWVGIQEASREYGGITVPIEKVKILKETDDEITIMVEAIDNKTGSSRLGMKTQKKVKVGKNGTWEDPFFMEAAVSKAQRNAIRALLPQTLLKQWIERHRSGIVKEIPATKNTTLPANGNGGEGITQKQINTLRLLANKLGWNDEQMHLKANVKSLKYLTKNEATELIDLWNEAAGNVLDTKE